MMNEEEHAYAIATNNVGLNRDTTPAVVLELLTIIDRYSEELNELADELIEDVGVITMLRRQRDAAEEKLHAIEKLLTESGYM